MKRISMVFEKEIPKNELEKLGLVISYDGINAVLEIAKDKVSLITSHLLNHYPVADLTIEEPQIEDIISEIFSSQKV